MRITTEPFKKNVRPKPMLIVQQLFEIIVRKRQPQDIAYSINAAVITIGLTIALGTAVYSRVPQFSMPLAYNLTLSIVQALSVYGLLAIANKSNRYIQTITALFGVSVILQILTIGVGMTGILSGFGLLFTIWNMVLIIFIIRAALECSTLQAIIQTIAYHFIMLFVLILLFPSFPQEAQEFVQAAQLQAQGQ